MNNSQLFVVINIVDSSPNSFFNLKSLYFLHIIKWEFISNSCIWAQAFSTNQENEFLIKLTYTKGLPSFFKIRQHNPFLRRDRIVFTSIQTLNKWSSTISVSPICHPSESINTIFELMDNMVSPCIEHIIQRLQERSIFIKDICFIYEFLCLRIEPTHYKKLSLWSYHVSAIVINIEFICNHYCLCHVIHYFVRVDKLCSWF